MILLTEAQITQFVGQFIWPLFRITALFMAMPVIGTQLVPARARLVLAIAFTLLISPLLPELPSVPPLSLSSLMIVMQQVIIGLTIGFFLQIFFQIFVLAGQFISMKMGLGFAAMNDPASGVSVTVISQYYLIIVTLLFLLLNGHLVVIEMIAESFTFMPISASGISAAWFWQIAASGSWLFDRALLVSLPIMTTLLVVNLGFGVMSRAAPQMNIFSLTVPVTLVLGLALIWLSFTNFIGLYQSFFGEALSFLNNMVGAS